MLITALTLLPSALDRPDGQPFGMFKALGLIVLLGAVILGLLLFVGGRRDKRGRKAEPPVYPILEPPHGRGPDQRR